MTLIDLFRKKMHFDNISLLSLQIMYFIDILLVKVVKLTWNKKLCDRRKYSTVVGKKKPTWREKTLSPHVRKNTNDA